MTLSLVGNFRLDEWDDDDDEDDYIFTKQSVRLWYLFKVKELDRKTNAGDKMKELWGVPYVQ